VKERSSMKEVFLRKWPFHSFTVAHWVKTAVFTRIMLALFHPKVSRSGILKATLRRLEEYRSQSRTSSILYGSLDLSQFDNPAIRNDVVMESGLSPVCCVYKTRLKHEPRNEGNIFRLKI